MKKLVAIFMALIIITTSNILIYAEINESENQIKAIAITMDEPAVGKTPAQTAITDDDKSTYVTDVKWEGEFDENGCFIYGKTYDVYVSVAVKEGLGLTIFDWYDHNFTINGKEAKIDFTGDIPTSGVMRYTYEELGVPHQNHCFCGGDITAGEHLNHKQCEYKKWNGSKAIAYTDNAAYVYMTKDITIDETLRVPGGKTLNLCLNGYTLRKNGGGRVINISSGGKLRLCDCSLMGTGKITGGSHEMGGGIHNGGTFIMYGGKIIGNRGLYGGGLWNNYNFYFYGGEICHNEASYGGGLWNANSGDAELMIFGGGINKNKATYGGGMWNYDNGNVVMKGGEFVENIAGKCGGGVWNQGKNFIMEDGNILKNYAQNGGGVWTQSMFTMLDGFITFNEAVDPAKIYDENNELKAFGGGVWVNEGSIFYMKGGQISLNTSDKAAGGVWISNDAEFVMSGGSIAANSADIGGGVYIQRISAPGIFRLGGDSEIVNNTGTLAGGGMYIQGILEVTGGLVESNYSDSEFKNLAIEPIAEVREGTILPTEFVDVPADAYFYQPVLWAIENNITNGTSEITFSPYEKCNLAQVLTFLWRAAGCPEVKPKPLIADVYEDDYFYMAAYWAQSLGIFERALYPNTSSTRLSAIYFIWYAAGKPECDATLEFTDITDPKYERYYDAIAWAVEQGITNGTSETTFSPGKTCTRAEILTFLWRADSKGWI